MAELHVFGKPGCTDCQGLKQYLSKAGLSVRVGDSSDSALFHVAITKALAKCPAAELMAPESSLMPQMPEQLSRSENLAASLTEHPELLVAPLVVRGQQVIVATRPDQAGALRY